MKPKVHTLLMTDCIDKSTRLEVVHIKSIKFDVEKPSLNKDVNDSLK